MTFLLEPIDEPGNRSRAVLLLIRTNRRTASGASRNPALGTERSLPGAEKWPGLLKEMNRWKRRWLAVVLVGLLVVPAALAQDGEAVLAKIDSVLEAPHDMVALQKMTLIDAKGSEKVRTVKIFAKGSRLRLIRFLEPAEVRGVGFLRLPSDRLYLYLPAFRRVRRIASSVKNENFMGTDFSYEDMSQTSYRKDYSVSAFWKEKGLLVLELMPRKGRDVSYGKLVLYADPATYVLRKVDFYDRRGNAVKILTIDRIEKIGRYWTPRRMEMRTLKTGHRTLLELVEVKYDQGLKDRFFTQRNLKRIR
jgi:outer membrane lipoprotein-sorting protein